MKKTCERMLTGSFIFRFIPLFLPAAAQDILRAIKREACIDDRKCQTDAHEK